LTPDGLQALIERLAQGPVVATEAGRHLYLWHGDPEVVQKMVPPSLRRYLDLRVLVRQLPRTPYAADEARRLLRAEIERKLREQMTHPLHQVLLVSGCGLLARYRVPLRPFYSFVSDRRVVILVVPRQESEFIPPAELPGFIRLDPAATFTALSRVVGEQSIVQD